MSVFSTWFDPKERSIWVLSSQQMQFVQHLKSEIFSEPDTMSCHQQRAKRRRKGGGPEAWNRISRECT